MYIRVANNGDAEAISSLIINTASTQLRNEFTDDGWDLFLRLLEKQTQKSLIENKKYKYLIALDENNMNILGVLAVKEVTHLFHFFVDPNSQGLGIGKSLWKMYLNKIHQLNEKRQNIKTITVNSSDYGIPFYQKIGFMMNSSRQKKNGVCYTPMTFTID